MIKVYLVLFSDNTFILMLDKPEIIKCDARLFEVDASLTIINVLGWVNSGYKGYKLIKEIEL